MQARFRQAGSGPRVVIAAAASDETAALRLWRALSQRGLACSINDAHIFCGEADALVTIVSAQSTDSLDFTRQITAFRDAGGETIMTARRSADSALPPSLTAIRGPDGLLTPAPDPVDLGVFGDDEASLVRTARAVRGALGLGAAQAVTDQVRRHGGAGAAVLAIIAGLGSAGLTHWLGQADIVQAQREVAVAQARVEDARTQAQLTDQLIAELAGSFPVNPSGEAVLRLADGLESVLLDDRLDQRSDANLVQQARLFHAIGQVRDVHRNPDDAQAAFERAHEVTGAVLDRQGEDPQRLLAHAHSAFYAGDSAYRRGELETAAQYYAVYESIAAQLIDRDPQNSLFRAEMGHAATNTGIVALERGEIDESIALFSDALRNFEGPAIADGHVGVTDLANAYGWRAKALQKAGRFQAAADQRGLEAELYAQQRRAGVFDSRLVGRHANALYRQGTVLAFMGRTEEADAVIEDGLELIDALVAQHPDNIRYARIYLQATRERARLAYWRGELNRAKLLLDNVRAFMERSDRAGQDDDRHIDRGLNHLLAAEIALAANAADTARFEAADAIFAGEHALRAGFVSARSLLASAYYLDAEARRLAGDDVSASRSLREAITHVEALEDEAMTANHLALLSQAKWRLGEVESAMRIRSELDSMGYRRPDYLRFWADVDTAASADATATTHGDNRG